MATRTRKSPPAIPAETPVPTFSSPKPTAFADLTHQILSLQEQYDSLTKDIALTRQNWLTEQQERDLTRKREAETYAYETSRTRKQAEDEFADRKSAWEKQLSDQKQILETERKELAELRKIVAAFPEDKEKTVKQAAADAQKQLAEKFETDKKLRDQEFKSEREISALKISNLTADNSRLQSEVEALKKSLEDATCQIKDIAVRVIDTRQPSPNNSTISP